MTLATPDDLADRVGVQFTDAQFTRAEVLLRDASAAVRRATGQTISRVENDTVSIPARYGNEIVLTERPADEPTAVFVNGIAYGNWTFDGVGTLTNAAGWQVPLASGASSRVLVTYSHGHAEIPDEIVRIVCQVAMRAMSNPDQLTREGVGDWTGDYTPPTLTRQEAAEARTALGLPNALSVSMA